VKAIWAILCQGSSVDRETNLVSLFNIVEELVLPAPPPAQAEPPVAPLARETNQFVIPPAQIVVLWERSDPTKPETGRSRFRMLLPGGGEATSQAMGVDLTQYPRARQITRLASFPLSREEGLMRIVVETMTDTSEWTPAFELPVQVRFQRQDPS
jgi:hypothetical protein